MNSTSRSLLATVLAAVLMVLAPSVTWAQTSKPTEATTPSTTVTAAAPATPSLAPAAKITGAPTEAVVAPAPSGTKAPEDAVQDTTPSKPGEISVPVATVLERVTLFGYAKVAFTYFVPAPDADQLVAARSGFRLLNARLGVSIAATDNLDVVASVEGSAITRSDVNALEGSRNVRLRDAYVEWRPSTFLELRAGQFKPPFNAETLLADSALPFVTRSLVSEGIIPPEGFREDGLSLERQVGVQAASKRIGTGLVGLRYAFAVVNGNGQNQLQNDNNSVTPVGRFALELGDAFILGANAYYDEATVGELPTRLTEKYLGYGGDLSLRIGGLTALGVVVLRSGNFSEGLDDENAIGAMGSLHYHHRNSGLELGGRYSFLDSSDLEDTDRLTEITAMLGYHAQKLPLRLLLQYTLRGEQVSVDNNSVDALLQITF